MKRYLLAGIGLLLTVYSCGGSLQSGGDVPAQISYNEVDRSYLVFDPFSAEADQPLGIPFPNDLFWASGTRGDSYVYIDTSSVSDPAEKLLFEAINKLQIKGLSPNTPILIPLSSDKPLEMNSLSGKFLLVDLTALEELYPLFVFGNLSEDEKEELFSTLLQSSRLYPSQDGRFLKFYPVKPLEAGHRYLFVLLDGIKDVDGKELLPAQIYDEVEGDTPLNDARLEALRESYRELYQSVFPALSQLLGVELNRDTVLEAFTFTTADKTLSLKDLSSVEKVAEGEESSLEITGLPYSQIDSDYRTFDPQDITVSPLYGVLKFIISQPQLVDTLRSQRLFPAFDIRKLNEFFALLKAGQPFDINDFVKFIPVYIGNGENYSGTVYIFQHGLGSDRTRAENLTGDITYPVVAIDLPYHGDYTKLTENSDFECGEGKCYLTANVGADRVNIYQSVFNLRLLELLLRSGVYDINGDGTGDTVQTVDFVGVSMGAITGSIYARFGTPDKVVLNVGGGNYVSIIDAAKNELIEGLLASTGVKKNTNGYAVLLGIFQTVLDPADPVYIGTEDKDKTLIQSACCDTVVPYVSNLALSERVGYSSFVRLSTGSDFENPPATPGWYLFGDENHWVHHSFLIHTNLESYPEVQPHTTEEYLVEAEKAARKQIEEFFSQ